MTNVFYVSLSGFSCIHDTVYRDSTDIFYGNSSYTLYRLYTKICENGVLFLFFATIQVINEYFIMNNYIIMRYVIIDDSSCFIDSIWHNSCEHVH